MLEDTGICSLKRLLLAPLMETVMKVSVGSAAVEIAALKCWLNRRRATFEEGASAYFRLRVVIGIMNQVDAADEVDRGVIWVQS